MYPNFPDPELHDPERAYHAENAPRLADVAAVYDTGGFFATSRA